MQKGHGVMIGAMMCVVALFTINISQCDTASLVEIVSPEEGRVTNECQGLEITFPSGQKPQLIVLMNYMDITSIVRSYTTSTGVSVPGEALCPYHGEGNNLIQVTAWTASTSQIAERRFIYDTKPPRIDVTSIDDLGNGTIGISGELVDAAGARSLVINGVEAPIEEGRFSLQIADAHFLTFEASDIFGAQTRYTVARPGTFVEEALGMRLNESAFDDLAAYLSQYMGDLSQICPNLTTMNPIASGSVPQNGVTIHYEVNITESSCGLPYTILHPSSDSASNAMVVGLAIPDLRIVMSVSGSIESDQGSQPFAGTMTVTADLAEVLDDVPLAVEENRIVAGEQTITVSLTNFAMTSEGLPEGFEAILSAEDVEALFEEALAAALTEVLNATVDQVLAILNNMQGSSEYTGFTVQLALLPQSLLLSSGKMTYFSKGMIDTDDANPDVSFFPGSFFTDDVAPDFDTVEPTGGESYDVAMTLSDDFINQFFYVLYTTGSLDESFLVDIPEDDPTVQLLLALFGIDPSSTDQLQVSLASLMPPAMRFDQFDTADTAALNWQDLLVNLAPVDPSGETGDDIIGLLISSLIPIIVEITDHNTISIQLSEETSVSIESTPEATYTIPTAAIEDALNSLIASAIAEINAQIPEIPLPTFDDGINYTLLEVKMNLDGRGGFMTLFANLD